MNEKVHLAWPSSFLGTGQQTRGGGGAARGRRWLHKALPAPFRLVWHAGRGSLSPKQQQTQLSEAAEPQITPCPFISLSIIGHLPLASPDVCLDQMSMRFSVFIESLIKSSSWLGTLIVHFIWVPYHVQNVPGTIRRHKRLRKHSFGGGCKLTLA